MDKGIRNIFIATLATVVVTFIGAWIQLNSRIAVLEVQVKNDRENCIRYQVENEQNSKEIKVMLQQIQIGVQHLQDVKADK